MKTQDSEILIHIVKSTDMGMSGINDILPKVSDEKLKTELLREREEYLSIHKEACEIMRERGEEAEGVGVLAKDSSRMMTEMQTAFDSSASKLAEMMIKGTTMGVTKSIKKLNDYTGNDEKVRSLCERLARCEEARINNLKAFL